MVVQSSRCPMRPLNWSINCLELLFRRAMWPTSLLFCLKDAWIFSKDTPPGMQVFYKTPCYWLPLIFFFLTNCVSISARNIQCMYTAIWRTSLSYLDLNLTEIIWINLAYVYVGGQCLNVKNENYNTYFKINHITMTLVKWRMDVQMTYWIC